LKFAFINPLIGLTGIKLYNEMPKMGKKGPGIRGVQDSSGKTGDKSFTLWI
jgi:hypothetical protein